ncbi:DUF1934 domain-containing protein [Leuconostoc palmae]|uniref:DUF1934 domain-containing protein n=1 Tax=Leuconostoc palmae TaxID=501487 RepID=UPI001C7E1B87|nr:DUF1934 domain-containing protein [Leuconostoc palmae]
MTDVDQRPIDVLLKTTIRQENEFEEFQLHADGLMYRKNNNLFIKYSEHLEGQNDTQVLFKIKNKTVRLNRSGDSNTKLIFTQNELLSATYQTAAGQMQLETKTELLDVSLSEDYSHGTIKINYQLFAQNALIGQYEVFLQFTDKSSKLN